MGLDWMTKEYFKDNFDIKVGWTQFFGWCLW